MSNCLSRMEYFKDERIEISVKTAGEEKLFVGKIKNIGNGYFSVSNDEVRRLFFLNNVSYIQVDEEKIDG